MATWDADAATSRNQRADQQAIAMHVYGDALATVKTHWTVRGASRARSDPGNWLANYRECGQAIGVDLSLSRRCCAQLLARDGSMVLAQASTGNGERTRINGGRWVAMGAARAINGGRWAARAAGALSVRSLAKIRSNSDGGRFPPPAQPSIDGAVDCGGPHHAQCGCAPLAGTSGGFADRAVSEHRKARCPRGNGRIGGAAIRAADGVWGWMVLHGRRGLTASRIAEGTAMLRGDSGCR